MDIFVLDFEEHCIKVKQFHCITITKNIFLCVQSNLAYFPTMLCPLEANLKAQLSK